MRAAAGAAPALLLRPGKEKSLLRRHPWVYDTAVARVAGAPARGETVAVRSADGRFLAWAAYAPESTLRARCWTYAEDQTVDAALLRQRVAAAVARRRHLRSGTTAMRLVSGEADGLPGFVADRYADQLVVQLQSAGADAWRDVLIDALASAAAVPNVFDRSDSATRAREGLPETTGLARGAEPPAWVEIAEHGLRYRVDVRRGHKTGFYIDQRENRLLVRTLVGRLAAESGRPVRVLNVFAYTGGFSVAAAAGGAGEVWSVDSSADALALAREHWAMNGFDPGRARWQCADAFDALRQAQRECPAFDLIVLDPPKFAASHRHVERAARAYKDINLSALKVLAPGGMLLTFSCSGAIGIDLFQKIVAGAVFDAGCDVQLVRRLAAGEDHPMLVTHPEGEYLKGLALQRI